MCWTLRRAYDKYLVRYPAQLGPPCRGVLKWKRNGKRASIKGRGNYNGLPLVIGMGALSEILLRMGPGVPPAPAAPAPAPPVAPGAPEVTRGEETGGCWPSGWGGGGSGRVGGWCAPAPAGPWWRPGRDGERAAAVRADRGVGWMPPPPGPPAPGAPGGPDPGAPGRPRGGGRCGWPKPCSPRAPGRTGCFGFMGL